MFVSAIVFLSSVRPLVGFAEKMKKAAMESGIALYFRGADEKIGPKINQIKVKTALLRTDLQKINEQIEAQAKKFSALNTEWQRAVDKLQKAFEMGLPFSDLALNVAQVRSKMSETLKNLESDMIGIFEIIKPGDAVKNAINMAVPSFETDAINAGQITEGIKRGTEFFNELSIEAAAKDYKKIVTELIALKNAEKAKESAIAKRAAVQVVVTRQDQRRGQQKKHWLDTQAQQREKTEARRSALRTFLSNSF